MTWPKRRARSRCRWWQHHWDETKPYTRGNNIFVYGRCTRCPKRRERCLGVVHSWID